MEQLLEKYRSLSERERILVVVGGIGLVIALFYALVWSPLQTTITTSKKGIANKQELLVWVEQNANKAIQLKQSAGGGRSFTGSLPQAVNQAAARNSIDITRMQPQKDEIQVWVDKASFDSTLSWLQQMEQMGINIAEADIAETDETGMIKVRRLRLSR